MESKTSLKDLNKSSFYVTSTAVSISMDVDKTATSIYLQWRKVQQQNTCTKYSQIQSIGTAFENLSLLGKFD